MLLEEQGGRGEERHDLDEGGMQIVGSSQEWLDYLTFDS